MPATVTLPALLALYKLDRELHTLQVGLENVQREQKRQQAKIAELTRGVDAQQTTTQKLQADINIRELDLKTRQQHIEKLRGSLNTTKTNKDYSAILVHISAEKAEVSKLESALLESMQLVENGTKTVNDGRKQIEGENQLLAQLEAEHAGKVSALQTQIASLKARRADVAKAVPADALRLYERVSQKFPGDALAPVDYDENDLETASCGSCYMGLNVEHINALRSRDELRRCDSCYRILYLPEMLQQPASPVQ